MPFVNREEWDRINDDNARMAEELRGWEMLGPFLDIARQLQDKVIELIETGMDADEIGRLAYQSVMAAEAEKARDQVAARYEQEHRKSLYEQVLAEIETQEGDSIMGAVTARLDTDAKLATELRDSARKELTARAKGVISDNVTREQQAVIDRETERQMALDRFDVAFALTGAVDLKDKTLEELLRSGDKLVVMFDKDEKGQAGLTFVWREDVHGHTGWVLGNPVKVSRDTYYTNYTQVKTGNVPKDRFITLGAQMPDLTNGGTAVRPDQLVAHNPLALGWRTNSGGDGSYTVQVDVRESQYSYGNTTKVPGIATTDFQTRDLEFAVQ